MEFHRIVIKRSMYAKGHFSPFVVQGLNFGYKNVGYQNKTTFVWPVYGNIVMFGVTVDHLHPVVSGDPQPHQTVILSRSTAHMLR